MPTGAGRSGRWPRRRSSSRACSQRRCPARSRRRSSACRLSLFPPVGAQSPVVVLVPRLVQPVQAHCRGLLPAGRGVRRRPVPHLRMAGPDTGTSAAGAAGAARRLGRRSRPGCAGPRVGRGVDRPGDPRGAGARVAAGAILGCRPGTGLAAHRAGGGTGPRRAAARAGTGRAQGARGRSSRPAASGLPGNDGTSRRTCLGRAGSVGERGDRGRPGERATRSAGARRPIAIAAGARRPFRRRAAPDCDSRRRAASDSRRPAALGSRRPAALDCDSRRPAALGSAGSRCPVRPRGPVPASGGSRRWNDAYRSLVGSASA